MQAAGCGAIGSALALTFVALRHDWGGGFDHPNIVEFLAANALPGLGLLVILALLVLGIAFLSRDILEVDAERSLLICRLQPPLQPTRRYPLSRFHTVGVEVVTDQHMRKGYLLEITGSETTLKYPVGFDHEAFDHALKLAQAGQFGLNRRPYWDVSNRSLEKLEPPQSQPQPLGEAVREDTDTGFEITFPGDQSWRWLLLLPGAGLMAASWWAMTPWYMYLVWMLLTGLAIAWFGYQGSPHTLVVKGPEVTYYDHGGDALYEVDLRMYNDLDIRGGEIVCATPEYYTAMILPRANSKEKLWIRDEMLQRVARKSPSNPRDEG